MAKSSRKTEPLSPLIRTGHARVTVLAGEAPAGLTFSLSGASHEIGRKGKHIPLSEDSTVSEVHATLNYRGDQLQVTDKGSLNGVYVKITGAKELSDGDWFRVGSQFFKFELLKESDTYETEDGTHYFTSPRQEAPFRILQILDGGLPGLSAIAINDEVIIGGQGATVVFTADAHLSARHAKISRNSSGKFSIEDMGSTNGTFVRIAGKETLKHGDLFYVGEELMRVEIT